MLLAPILCRTLQEKATYTLYQCWILMERNGTYGLSAVDATEAAEFATLNDITVRNTSVTGNTILLDVAPSSDLAQFYTWSEIMPGQGQPMCEVWRPFLWTWTAGNPEFDALGIRKGLAEIRLSETETVASVLLAYFGQMNISTRR
jgi:hypothetical protein